MMKFLANLPFQGWKTVLAALGLLGLALYLFSVGNLEGAWQALMNGLAALGLRAAIEVKPPTTPPVPEPLPPPVSSPPVP